MQGLVRSTAWLAFFAAILAAWAMMYAMATGMGAAMAARIAEGTPLPLPETRIRPIAWHALRGPVMDVGVRYYWMKDKLGFAS